MKNRMIKRLCPGWRGLVWTLAVVGLCVPSMGLGDVVRLKDGSTLRGRVLSMRNDTLTVKTSFGAEVRIPRDKIELVSFTDSLLSPPSAGPATTSMAYATGDGRIEITFDDTRISSKIGIKKRRDEEGHKRANWLEQIFTVDGKVVYSRIDSTMDKTIYNGPERIVKNTIELEDFSVELPAGLHHAELTVRNVGLGEYADAFSDAVDMTLPLFNLQVFPDKALHVKVTIKRGKLRMGKPRFERVE